MIGPGPIGTVLGTQPTTPYEFWFLVAPGQLVRLDDVVVARTRKPDGGAVAYFGMVDEVLKRHEGVTFESDVEDVQAGVLPVNTAYSAHVRVIRLDPEEFVPPQPGDLVALAEGEDFRMALYQDKADVPRLPAGLLPGGGALQLNFDFLNGKSGAHVNISGVSGVATKTSYALFLLHAIFNSEALGVGRANARALIFNVKGEDLLFLDLPNARLSEKEAGPHDRYAALGLPKRPFQDVQLLAPPRPGRDVIVPDTGGRSGGITAYFWTLRDFCRQRLLPFCFADVGSSLNLGFIIGAIEDKLFRLTLDERDTPHVTVGDWEQEDDLEAAELGLDFADLGKTKIKTFRQLVAYVEYKLLGQNDGAGDPKWVNKQNPASIQAFVRRLRGVQKHLAPLIRGDASRQQADASFPNPRRAGVQLTVTDIHTLNAHAQMFVVGAMLKDLFEFKERTGDKNPVFIVLDELNKYAPRDGDSPIKDVLLDIAERGRSLGIILIGAQQTASEVERRVVGNAAIRVVGRLDPAEAERPEYRFLPQSFRLRAGILQPGSMLVSQPELPAPVLVKFPFPAYATRGDEVAVATEQAEVEGEASEWLGL